MASAGRQECTAGRSILTFGLRRTRRTALLTQDVRLLGTTTMEVLRDIGPTLVFSTAPGACGGVGLFLFSLRAGHYKNNRYVSKLIIELVGAMLVASFVGPLFPEKVVVFASFATGLSWATVIQVARSKITKTVKAAIGEEIR